MKQDVPPRTAGFFFGDSGKQLLKPQCKPLLFLWNPLLIRVMRRKPTEKFSTQARSRADILVWMKGKGQRTETRRDVGQRWKSATGR